MTQQKVLEYTFFFGLLAVVGYLVGAMLYPFLTALSLAVIIATIFYPIHKRILRRVPRQQPSVAAAVSTVAVLLLAILPLLALGAALFNEAVSVYQQLQNNNSAIANSMAQFESLLETYVPALSVSFDDYLQQALVWATSNLGNVFAGTASAVFTIFITLISVFYFLRDGEALSAYMIKVMPLQEQDERMIFARLAQSVRSVTNGIVLVALIQGCLTGLGMWIFGFENTFIWGVVAAFGALIPSVGTTLVLAPAVIYLLATGDTVAALGLTAWGVVAVGTIDNILGPYLMGRGNKIHPFLILLSVLGGISVFGFIGFLVGPIVASLFLVLLELYSSHIQVSSKK